MIVKSLDNESSINDFQICVFMKKKIPPFSLSISVRSPSELTKVHLSEQKPANTDDISGLSAKNTTSQFDFFKSFTAAPIP